MLLYVYSKCSTCKDAIRYLKEHGIKAEIREITDTPPTIAELKAMLHFQNNHLKKLINTSGNLYKEMHLAEKLDHLSLEQVLTLLSENGMLVKRPFLLGKDFGMTGFKEAEWSEKFKSKGS